MLCTDEHLLHPDPHPSIPAWCAARLAVTERRLDQVDPAARIVLVSHFPLDERLLKLWLVPRFSIWCGTRKTRDWHRRYPVDVVVYGHTHRRATDWLDGVRFEEVSLGYPRDWSQEQGMAAYVRPILPAPATGWKEPGRSLSAHLSRRPDALNPSGSASGAKRPVAGHVPCPGSFDVGWSSEPYRPERGAALVLSSRSSGRRPWPCPSLRRARSPSAVRTRATCS